MQYGFSGLKLIIINDLHMMGHCYPLQFCDIILNITVYMELLVLMLLWFCSKILAFILSTISWSSAHISTSGGKRS